jgi:hypothetical protein
MRSTTVRIASDAPASSERARCATSGPYPPIGRDCAGTRRGGIAGPIGGDCAGTRAPGIGRVETRDQTPRPFAGCRRSIALAARTLDHRVDALVFLALEHGREQFARGGERVVLHGAQRPVASGEHRVAVVDDGDAEFAQQVVRHRRAAVDELGTELDRRAGPRIVDFEQPATDAVARFEHAYAAAGAREVARRKQSCSACADDHDVALGVIFPHAAFLPEKRYTPRTGRRVWVRTRHAGS